MRVQDARWENILGGRRVTLPGGCELMQFLESLGGGAEDMESVTHAGPRPHESITFRGAICPLVERHFDCWCSQASAPCTEQVAGTCCQRGRLFLASLFNEHENLIRIFLLYAEDIRWTDF